jgi:limonene-1,2-epoxide hydrolase
MRYLVIILTFLIISCKPSLDLAPAGWKSTSSFYKNAADAQAAVTGAYGMLYDIYRNEHILTPNVIAADDGIPFLTGSADRIALWKYTMVPSNSYIGQIWSTAYRGIQFSNVVIDRVPGISMDDNLKKQYVAEAKFLRALHYFNLVRFYGRVPLVVKEITSLDGVMAPKAKLEEVYNQIETDLKDAEVVLPKGYTGSNVGRATQGAAKGLLAKVYLTRAGNTANSPYWDLAAKKAKEVMDLKIYDLWDDYADVYALKNRCGKESLFEVLFVTDVQGNSFTTGYAPRGAPIVPSNGFGIFRVSKSLFDQYIAKDKRKAVTFLTSYVNPTTQQTVQLSVETTDPALAVSFWKLADPTTKIGSQGGTSWPYMRYSEVLLIYAEALNEAKGAPDADAYDAINKVRHRAGLDDLKGLSKEAFKDAILLERRLEFCFEGQRWFDLVRTGRLLAAVKAENSFGRDAPITASQVLLPIPQREVDVNPALKD